MFWREVINACNLPFVEFNYQADECILFIHYFDGDDVLYPEKFTLQVEALKRNPIVRWHMGIQDAGLKISSEILLMVNAPLNKLKQCFPLSLPVVGGIR
jgi:hypothetical protein